MEQHLAFHIEENVRAGMSPAEARRQARMKLGRPAAIGEEYRAEERFPFLEDLLRDLAFAVRLLVKSPGFTAIVILTMAFASGAATAIFSVVDAALLQPLPYQRPEELVRIVDDLPGAGSRDVGMSTPELRDFERSGIFQSISPAWFDDQNLTGSARPVRVGLVIVAPDYLPLLGAKPQLGSVFNPRDRTPGVIPEAVISDGMWKRVFGGDPRVLGKDVRLDSDLYRIIGVMPPDFRNPGPTTGEREIDVWVAGGFAAAPFLDPSLRARQFTAPIARLRSGLSMAAAQSRVDALVSALEKQYPGDYPSAARWSVRLVPLQASVTGGVRQSLFFLLGAVGLVLLAGCVSIANLLLARASARGRELAVRQALGAAGGRLTRQLLTESLVLSAAGAAAGLAILFLSKGPLLQMAPDSIPRLNEISLNGRVLLFAFGASLLAGLVFGVAPAWHARRPNLAEALKEKGRGSTGAREQARTRQTLVVTELALSLVLMIAASLLLRSFWDLAHVRLGFNPESVITVRTRLPYPNDAAADVYRTSAQKAPFFREVLRRAKTLPGVEEAAIGNTASIPLNHGQEDQNFLPVFFEGRPVRSGAAPLVDTCSVTPEYFHLMGMTLLRGRLFDNLDSEKTPEAAVINEAMAQTYWPNENSIGKRLKLSASASSWITVVGVVANARTESLEEARVPQIFASSYQRGYKRLAVFLRGPLNSAAIPGELRDGIQAVDSSLPVFGAQTLTETVSASLAQRRFAMQMVSLFALAGLFLGALGIYGVISFMVGERTHEIGIRLALGANRMTILAAVLRQGMRLAMAGAAIGLVGGWIASHLMAKLLYGVSPADPLTFAGVTLLFTGVACAACYLPAMRAIRVDPLLALRWGARHRSGG